MNDALNTFVVVVAMVFALGYFFPFNKKKSSKQVEPILDESTPTTTGDADEPWAEASPTILRWAFFDEAKPYEAPTRGTPQAAGLDLCAAESVELLRDQPTLISTNLVLEIPEGYYGRIAPRSGLSTKGVFVNAGVIDADYRGEVKVVLQRTTQKEISIAVGDRIAQLILERIADDVELVQISPDALTASDRGAGGFGSTGK